MNTKIALTAVIAISAAVGSTESIAKCNGYKSENFIAFVENCVSTGGNRSSCGCIMDGIVAQVSADRFNIAEVELALTGSAPDWFIPVVIKARANCL